MGEHARLAHLGDFGQRADGQAFQADLRGQAQRRIDDGRLGLLALLQGRPSRAARGLEGSSVTDMGSREIKRTVVLFCMKQRHSTGLAASRGAFLAVCRVNL
jgi:hypothetical protein